MNFRVTKENFTQVCDLLRNENKQFQLLTGWRSDPQEDRSYVIASFGNEIKFAKTDKTILGKSWIIVPIVKETASFGESWTTSSPV